MSQHPFDAITAAHLRELGSAKWTALPGGYGAGVAEMDFGTAPPVCAAITRAATDGLLGYLPEWAATELSQACADWYGSAYGWSPDPRWVWPITDGLTGLQLAIDHFTAPGSPVIVPTPAYMPFLTVPRALGRDVIEVPMREGTLDFDGIAQAFAAGAGMVILCNPHNPTGRVSSRGELETLSQTVADAGGRVLADEIWAPLRYGKAVHVPYASVNEAAAEHTVTVTSAAKAWNIPGIKCAQFIASNPHDAARFTGRHLSHLRPASTVGALANIAAYREGAPWLAEVLEYLEGNRALVVERLGDLPGVSVALPDATYLAWVDCRRARVADPASQARTRAHTYVVDGIECGRAGAGFLRFNFAMPRPVLRDALDGVCAVLGAGA